MRESLRQEAINMQKKIVGNIRLYMEARGLKIDNVAESIGYSVGRLQDMFECKSVFNMDVLKSIAMLVEVSLICLMN